MSDNFQNGQDNGFEPQNPDNSAISRPTTARLHRIQTITTAIRISAETTSIAFRELKT